MTKAELQRLKTAVLNEEKAWTDAIKNVEMLERSLAKAERVLHRISISIEKKQAKIEAEIGEPWYGDEK